ncbi:MAG: TIGR00730 family Rossman fold protein [Gemmataceae bacterium]|nr:TIGR00730 family Rossman fold protein [Gemmataceae bacterium]
MADSLTGLTNPGDAVPWGHKTDPSLRASKFLQGPQKRSYEFWRAFKIFRELLYGFRKLHFVGPCVTVFGSARFGPDHPYYVMAREVGRQLALQGFTVMTGGGPGIMEAANRGARDVGGRSIGCNIKLPKEQKPNDYLDAWVDFEYFFVRKLMLVKYSYAFIVMPGGFGTMDEMFELLTLIQTGKVEDFPVALMGREFYDSGIAQLRVMVEQKTIDLADLDKLTISDDPAKVVADISAVAMKKFGLSYGPKVKPRWWLGEEATAAS